MLQSMPELGNVLDNLNFGITIIDSTGRYLFVNKTLLAYTGRSRKDYINRTVYDFIRDGIYDKSAADMVLRTKQIVSRLHTSVSASGEKITRLTTASPIFNDQGDVVFIVTALVDVDLVNQNYAQAKAQMAAQQSIQAGAQQSVPHSKFSARSNTASPIAESPEMKTLLFNAKQAAKTESAILLQGESGTGKEVVARYIHEHSAHSAKEMVAINCASLPESLLEAELFGYEKGAFTGALSSGKVGIIESAQDSTLLLDEVNSMPLSLQAKLLRVLETKTILRVGSVKPRPVNFRLISAANVDLALCVRDGSFRADLFYRLDVIPLTLPPLRKRKKDIVPLANHFLKMYCEQYSLNKEFSPKVYQALLQYDWPGNIRELRNFVERMVVMSSSDVVKIRHFPQEMLYIPVAPEPHPVAHAMEEREQIEEALKLNGGHRENTARYLGISRRTLQYKLKKYNLK